MIWFALIPAWLKRAVAGFVAAMSIIGGAFLAGRRNAKQAAKTKAAAAYIKTRERMDDADIDSSNDPGVLRQWLHDRRDDKQ